MRAMIFILIA